MKALLCLLSSLLRAVFSPATYGAAPDVPYKAVVVHVADGDTITVATGLARQKIRIVGIDAPESAQRYGYSATRALDDLLLGRTVYVEPASRDKYGRQVAKVTVDGVDAGLALISVGLAWHYRQYARNQSAADRAAYAAAERAARSARRGLWQDDRPTPPWTYRRSAWSWL